MRLFAYGIVRAIAPNRYRRTPDSPIAEYICEAPVYLLFLYFWGTRRGGTEGATYGELRVGLISGKGFGREVEVSPSDSSGRHV